MGAQICKNCKHKEETCYCSPNSTCSHHEEVDTKHTVFDRFKSMNIDELSEWLDEYGMFDGSPWIEWFDKSYCQKCDSVIGYYSSELENEPRKGHEFAYCELNGYCRFFNEMNAIPDNKQIIKMWLESEVE